MRDSFCFPGEVSASAPALEEYFACVCRSKLKERKGMLFFNLAY